MHGGERHHHGGEAFVAGGDTDDAAARGQGADQAAEDSGGIVAIGQAVEHAGSALGAAVARIGDEARERDRAESGEFLGAFANLETDLPVAGVIAEGDGFSVFVSKSAQSRENQIFVVA